MPVLALGVFENDECAPACLAALQCGYRLVRLEYYLHLLGFRTEIELSLSRLRRHIDSARYYKNEAQVGQAVRESGIPREEIFVSASCLHQTQADKLKTH